MSRFLSAATPRDPRTDFSLPTSVYSGGILDCAVKPAGSAEKRLVCRRCGGEFPLEEMARDASRASGRKGVCRGCDRARSRAYYAAHRVEVLARAAAKRPAPAPRSCSECGESFEGRWNQLVCGRRCKDARYRRRHPEAYAAKEARKVERRRARRRGEAA